VGLRHCLPGYDVSSESISLFGERPVPPPCAVVCVAQNLFVGRMLIWRKLEARITSMDQPGNHRGCAIWDDALLDTMWPSIRTFNMARPD
jgi:hypothetical protein